MVPQLMKTRGGRPLPEKSMRKKVDKSEKDEAYKTNDLFSRWMENSHDDMTARMRLKIKKSGLPMDQPMDESTVLTHLFVDRPSRR